MGGGDGFGDFVGICHAGGDNHGLACLGNVANQRQINGFKRGDFVGGGVQAFQQIDGGEVKRGAENCDADFARVVKQGRVPIPWHVGFLVELVQRLPVPQPAVNHKFGGAAGERDGVGGVGLDFDGIGACGFGFVYDAKGGFQAAVMVGGHFGDDVGGVVVADGAVVDLHGVVLCKERKGGF